MKRKHIVFFTIVTLVAVVALLLFQMGGDRTVVPGAWSPNPQGSGTTTSAPDNAPNNAPGN